VKHRASVALRAAGLAALLSVSACDVALGGIVAPGAIAQRRLGSGTYLYQAWSDRGGYGPAWWGYLELETRSDGAVIGVYRLPRQCVDDYGFEADCVGRVGGRVDPDGTLRFGLDEGWLRNQGAVRPGWRASGSWETRILGYRDAGTFELSPR
jgi:hypothetical protein